MAKQKLTPEATAAKAKRDLAYAKTPFRRKRKAENQRLGQKNDSDIHHKSDGTTERVSIKQNRGNFGKGTKTENMSTAFKLKYTNGKKADPSAFPFKVVGGVGSSSPTKFLNFSAANAKKNMADSPWTASFGLAGLLANSSGGGLGGLLGLKKGRKGDINRRYEAEYETETAQDSTDTREDVPNVEEISEPNEPKSKTQELEKAVKDVKKVKSKPKVENQANEEETLQN